MWTMKRLRYRKGYAGHKDKRAKRVKRMIGGPEEIYNTSNELFSLGLNQLLNFVKFLKR